jgi:hypothetical protein
MKRAVILLAFAVVWASSLSLAAAQNYSRYQFLFTGMLYQTNSLGNVVGTPITDQTLLADRARLGGITNLNSIALAYHINGDPKGDTIEVISATNGASLALEFGLWFGSDPSLGRVAVTNLAGTQEKRVEFVYTLDTTTYTVGGSDSIGAAFISKQFTPTGNGSTNVTITGTLSWNAYPHGTNTSSLLAVGKFSLGKPLF